MYSDEDWNAAMSSEVFRNYASTELKKANQAPNVKNTDLEAAFKEFELQIKASSKLTATFRKLQEVFKTNKEYTQKVDPIFVAGVLSLDLTDGCDYLVVEEDSE